MRPSFAARLVISLGYFGRTSWGKFEHHATRDTKECSGAENPNVRTLKDNSGGELTQQDVVAGTARPRFTRSRPDGVFGSSCHVSAPT